VRRQHLICVDTSFYSAQLLRCHQIYAGLANPSP